MPAWYCCRQRLKLLIQFLHFVLVIGFADAFAAQVVNFLLEPGVVAVAGQAELFFLLGGQMAGAIDGFDHERDFGLFVGDLAGALEEPAIELIFVHDEFVLGMGQIGRQHDSAQRRATLRSI